MLGVQAMDIAWPDFSRHMLTTPLLLEVVNGLLVNNQKLDT